MTGWAMPFAMPSNVERLRAVQQVELGPHYDRKQGGFPNSEALKTGGRADQSLRTGLEQITSIAYRFHVYGVLGINEIEGTAVLAFGGILLAVPTGMAAGIYLPEFDNERLAPALCFF